MTNYPRVTDIIRLAGLSDFSKVNPDVLARSQEFGREVHRVCALWDRQRLVWSSVDPAVHPYLEAWMQFRKEVGWAGKEPLHIERGVVSLLYQYQGTPDRIFKGGYLVDIKSGAPNKAVALQLAGYQQAIKESLRIKIKHRFVVYLTPFGYNLIEYKSSMDWQAFLACRTLYRYLENL